MPPQAIERNDLDRALAALDEVNSTCAALCCCNCLVCDRAIRHWPNEVPPRWGSTVKPPIYYTNIYYIIYTIYWWSTVKPAHCYEGRYETPIREPPREPLRGWGEEAQLRVQYPPC